MTFAPATYLGDTVTEKTVLLGRVPEDAPEGQRVRALHFTVGETCEASGENFWLLRLGRIFNGKFDSLTREIAIDGSLPAGTVRRYSLLDPALVSRGEILSLRLSPRGAPPPLAGASVVVEWGVHASRRANRG